MTSTDLAVRMTSDQLAYVAKTELITRSYRGNLPAIMACVATGRELGIGDMHALRSIFIVDGKASLSAELMVTLTRQRGHSITADFSPGAVTVRGRRSDNGDEMSVTWDMEKASQAGLAVKPNWKSYPDAMLWARAVSQLCRMLFPDVLMGLAFTRDEFGETAVEIPGTALDDEVVLEGDVLEDVADSTIDEELLAQDSEGEDPGETDEGVAPSEDTFDQSSLLAEEASPAPHAAPTEAPVTGTDDAQDAAPPPGAGEKPLTVAQAKKLNVLVGTMRDAGRLSTQQVYGRVATMRNLPADIMVDLIEGARDEAGELHWGPLRDSLFRSEAHALIDLLEKREADLAARKAAAE